MGDVKYDGKTGASWLAHNLRTNPGKPFEPHAFLGFTPLNTPFPRYVSDSK